MKPVIYHLLVRLPGLKEGTYCGRDWLLTRARFTWRDPGRGAVWRWCKICVNSPKRALDTLADMEL